jgi:hypothetical protein
LSGALMLINSTVSGNDSSGRGAGLFSSGPLTLINSTVAKNDSGGLGGGVYVGPSVQNPTQIVWTSIIAANTVAGGQGPDFVPNPGAVLNIHSSLIGDAVGVTIVGPGNLIGDSSGSGVIDPLLGPLADNGGPTLTHALLPGSPALDQGDPSFDPNDFDPPLDYDQRGAPYLRVAEGDGFGVAVVDIGAFESQVIPQALLGDYNENGIVDAADYSVWRDTLEAGDTVLPNDPTPGVVDESDFLYWRDHFGETLGAGSGAASIVSEPTATDEAQAAAAAASAAPLRTTDRAPSVEKAPTTDGAASAVRAADFVASTSDFSLHRRAPRSGPVHSRFSTFFAPMDDRDLLLLATVKVSKERTADRHRFSTAKAEEAPVSNSLDALDDPLACALLDWYQP